MTLAPLRSSARTQAHFLHPGGISALCTKHCGLSIESRALIEGFEIVPSCTTDHYRTFPFPSSVSHDESNRRTGDWCVVFLWSQTEKSRLVSHRSNRRSRSVASHRLFLSIKANQQWYSIWGSPSHRVSSLSLERQCRGSQ